ncbi:MAG: hypothetical protein RL007_1513 [Bacteroidota bacterium]|jgi:hypothetical protein
MEYEHPLRHCIPTRLIKLPDGTVGVRWIYIKDIQFTDPFFEGTIQRAMMLPLNSAGVKSVSTLAELMRVGNLMPEVIPSAIIFHLSRCGSTLLSQMLGEDESNTMLAEVPILDQVLNAEQYGFQISHSDKRIYFGSIIRIHAGVFDETKKRLIVKADSWHILQYALLRDWYPQLPMFFLFRNPGAIINSHSKLVGMHAVRGSGIVDIPNTQNADYFSYLSSVLTEYYNRYKVVAEQDSGAFFLEYEAGADNMLKGFTDVVYGNCDEAIFHRMLNRARFHSKQVAEEYVTDSESKLKLMLLPETITAYEGMKITIDGKI